MQSAQELILTAVSTPLGDRTFEANAYPNMIQAQVASEKVKVVSSLLQDMHAVSLQHDPCTPTPHANSA